MVPRRDQPPKARPCKGGSSCFQISFGHRSASSRRPPEAIESFGACRPFGDDCARFSTSALAVWYRERIKRKGGRLGKTMIVALARKLLVALWKYATAGVLIEGAILKQA